MAVARADLLLAARAHERARVSAAPADRLAQRPAQLAPQAIELIDRQRSRVAARREPRLPQDLVGEQVADARDRVLVEEPRLDRRMAPADPPAKLLAADVGGVDPDVAVVGVEHRPAEPPAVAQRHPRPVLELDRKAVEARRLGGLLVDDD